MKMMTVHEVSKLSGVSVRTLHYYDEIGLLCPSQKSSSGYRLYDEDSLEKLQQILLFRELQFPLKDIQRIITSPDFDRNRALEQQIELLTLRKEHLENLILIARGIKMTGVRNLDFSGFDTRKIDEYSKQAKEQWGKTEAWKEYEAKTKNQTVSVMNNVAEGLMQIFAEFGKHLDLEPSDARVQALVKSLQDYMTEHFYTCTNEILNSLGKIYAGGGSMTENINAYGGEGTAEFASRAIEIFTGKKH